MRLNWFRPLAMCVAVLTISGCTGAALTAGALPADQGGMVPSVYYAMQAPSLAIYGDGRVLTAVTPTVAQLVPTRYELARIDAATVQGFVTTTLSGGLLSGATDFGTPRVTDLATTTVTVRGETGARWLVDGTTRVLAVNPLPLPGACP